MDAHSKLFGKILLVMLPALISGFFSYKIAVVEANAKTKETSSKADTGYTTLVAAVEKLQDRVDALSLENAEMKGYLRGLKVSGSSSIRPPAVESSAPAFKKFELPKNLGSAWEQRAEPLEAKKK